MSNISKSNFIDISILFIFVLVAFYLPLGNVPLFDLDEGAFSEATREMLLNKNFLTTYLNGELRFDKPIFIYWFQALSVTTFGLNEFALRLPSAIASTIWALGIFIFVSKYFDRKIAFFSLIIFISSLQINIITKAATADALLNMFIALSMFTFYHYYSTRNTKYLFITFALIGFGVLTKGPVAIMVPLVVSFIFVAIKLEFKFYFQTLFNLKAIALFLVIALPWYILEYIDQGQLFIDGFFLKHNLSRFNSTFEGHSGTYFYFIPVLILGLIPSTGLLIKTFMKIKEYFKSDLKLFLFIWFTFVFIFFSFSNTKLPHYVIYGYTPLFILIALAFNDYLSQEKQNIFLTIFLPLIIFLSIFILLPLVLQVIPIKDQFVSSIKGEITNVLDFYYLLKLLGLLALTIFIYRLKSFDLTKKFISVAYIFIIAMNFIIIPAVAKVQQEPIKNIALYAKEKKIQINMYKMNTPTFNVYSQSLVKKGTPNSGDYVMTKKIFLKDFKNYQILFEEMGIVLIKL